MRKKTLTALTTGMLLFGMASMAEASLTVIGSATYNGADYNLVWEDDNQGNSLVWLDYTNENLFWNNQMAWASGLDNQLTYNIDPQYSVSWTNESWRLPSTADNPKSGWNLTNSEMGYLYYIEFGLEEKTNVDPTNAFPFENLNNSGSGYWTNTEAGTYNGYLLAAAFRFEDGYQGIGFQDYFDVQGLAVREANVTTSTTPAVPAPASVLLFSAGLMGLAGLKRRREGDTL